MWPFDRKPKAQSEPARAQLATVATMARALTRSLPKERQTREPHTLDGMLQVFGEGFAGYPEDSCRRIVGVFRYLAQRDEDVGGSLRDLQALGNTSFVWQIEGGVRAAEGARRELEAWGQRVYPGGLKQLADNQVREVYISGASSLEWVPRPNRSGIAEVFVAEAEHIQIRRTAEGSLEYRQDFALQTDEPLHPLTYRYVPFDTDGSSRYGIPAMIPALSALARKVDLLKGQDRIVAALGKLAFVIAQIEKPSALSLGLESEQSPEYESALSEYTAAIADLIAAASEAGLVVTPQGVEVSSTNVTTNASGVDGMMVANQKLAWSGLGTQAFMRGDMSANYALAKVIYPILLAFADNIMEPIDANLEHGANLHLRLMGIPATARLERAEPPNPFLEEHANAAKTEAETDQILTTLFGEPYRKQAAERRGIAPLPSEREE